MILIFFFFFMSKSRSTPSLELMKIMDQCFEIDPTQRISAQQVLKSPFWLLDDVGVETQVKEMIDSGFLETALNDFGL
jgi:hypothetical protein